MLEVMGFFVSYVGLLAATVPLTTEKTVMGQKIDMPLFCTPTALRPWGR
jgi:hypothetical protein